MTDLLHCVIGGVGIMTAAFLEFFALKKGINGKSLSLTIGAIMFFVGLLFGVNIIEHIFGLFK
jgi:hypothetical protein